MTPQPRFVYVGSRTTIERGARGSGVEVYRVKQNEREWTLVQVVGGLTNPSFLVVDANKRFLYTVHGDRSEITSLAINSDTGTLTKVSTASTSGSNPVHLAIHPPLQSVLVANYATGSIVSIPISSDGVLGKAGRPLFLPGQPGPHRYEQLTSHPHQIAGDPSGRFFLVPDKGLDRVFTIAVSHQGQPEIVASAKTHPGAGPRHAIFHPTGRFAYVVNELDSTVTAYAFDSFSGQLSAIETVPTLPRNFLGANRAAALLASENGDFIFVSNRGHDSVVQFAVEGKTGRLSKGLWQPSLGQGPRFAVISPSGESLFVANELSDSIVSYEIGETGIAAGPFPTVDSGSPVSIAFI